MPIGKFTTQPKVGVTETRGNGSQLLGHGQMYQGSQRFGGMAPTQPIHPITRNMQPVSGFGPNLSAPRVGTGQHFDPSFGTVPGAGTMPGGNAYRTMQPIRGTMPPVGGNMTIDPNFGVMPGGNAYRTMQPIQGRWNTITPQQPASWRDHFYNLIRRSKLGGF